MRTGYTIITRESPWDEDSRGRAMRLAEYEAGMCGCGCQLPIAVAHDPDQVFKVDTYVCVAGKAMKQVARKADDDAEAQKRPDGWKDGLHYYAVPVDRDDLPPLPQRPTRGGKRG